MSKCIALAFFALIAIVCSLQAVEARRAGEGFCFAKYNPRTGACKKLMNKQQKQQKVDCCSGGGAAWSTLRKKDKRTCEPCRSSVTVTSRWSEWGAWSKCNVTCGPSYKVSKRTCLPEGETTCRGKNEKWVSCTTSPCPIDGGWSVWGNWSRCSKTCETGFHTRSRACTNPPPQFGGKECQGSLQQNGNCTENTHCPIHGGWGKWGPFSACSKTCELGTKIRERKCDSPKPQHGGRPCDEAEKIDTDYCREARICEDIFSGDSSGSGDWNEGSSSGSGSGSGSSGSGSGGSEGRAWRDNDDEDL